MEKVRADKLKAKLAEDEINVTDSVADVIRYHPYSTDHYDHYISLSTKTGSFFLVLYFRKYRYAHRPEEDDEYSDTDDDDDEDDF